MNDNATSSPSRPLYRVYPPPPALLAVVRKYALQIKDITAWHPEMTCAKQILFIGKQVVCSDQLLIQYVRYATIEQMQREITTLGIKKDVFSTFDMTISPMPKYCYPVPDVCCALLVHPVSPFTLEDLLTLCEQQFPVEYIDLPYHFYRTWLSRILSRYRNGIPGGKGKPFRAIKDLKYLVYPSPPRIPLRQRKQFAALLLHAVHRHHAGGVFHDCITTRTLFLRSVNQPVILANYSGIPSPTVRDFYPTDFNLMKQFILTYGKQMRDLFSLAQITVRILTGTPADHTAPFSDTPRPVRVIISELISRSGLLEKRPPREYRQYLKAVLFIIRNLALRTKKLFSVTRFPRWRRLNRATGGIWRMLPVIGPVGDIILPTRCASTIRSVLDPHWFYHQYIRKPFLSHPPRKPDVSVLLSALKTVTSKKYTCYETVFSRLQGEAAQKRHTFDSIMEASSLNPGSRKKMNILLPVILSSLLLLLMTVFLVLRLTHQSETSFDNREVSAVTADIPETSPPVVQPDTPQVIPSHHKELVTTVQPESSIIIAEPAQAATPPKTIHRKRKVKKKAKNKRAVHNASKPKRIVKKTARHSKLQPPEKDTLSDTLPAETSPPPPVCRLVPVTTLWNVYAVDGDCVLINLAELLYINQKTGDTTTLGKMSDRSSKYFLARKKARGFGKIIPVRLCDDEQCIDGLFYRETKGKTTGPAAVAGPGDIIGFSYFSLNAYLIRERKNR
jgi:hypothetical protein